MKRVLALVVAATFALAACEVPTNEEPVALTGPFARLETTTTSTTAPPEVATKDVVVWMLERNGGTTVLQPVPRAVDIDAGVYEILRNLFDQPPSDDRPAEVGRQTAIPSTAELLSAEPSAADPERLIVDVRGLIGSEGLQGVELRNALAQIVWTATEVGAGYQEVIFLNDGEPAEVVVDNLEITGDAVTRNEHYARRIG